MVNHKKVLWRDKSRAENSFPCTLICRHTICKLEWMKNRYRAKQQQQQQDRVSTFRHSRTHTQKQTNKDPHYRTHTLSEFCPANGRPCDLNKLYLCESEQKGYKQKHLMCCCPVLRYSNGYRCCSIQYIHI